MQEVCDFIKKCGTYYLATVDEDSRPRVRPFGTIHIFDGALCIQTGKVKRTAKQLDACSKAEICAFDGSTGTWLRVAGNLVWDERIEAQESMLDAYPNLKAMYTPGDGNTAVYRFEPGAIATFSSFTEPDRVVEL
ncbi:MAG: pyridoxamine 5'-phosphate oxidase family protein [Atopobiaceae bacterium]|nr:pyridoxamine 5'-phosphate oxidase family protein [Atopobiaceae bacterium]